MYRLCAPARHTRQWTPLGTPKNGWVQEVIQHRGKTNRNQECTPGYYNFEGEFQRRQDGNYNGGFFQYCTHLNEVNARMEDHFSFIRK